MMRVLTLLLLATLLSGCGIKGSLATPQPLLSKSAPVASVEAEDTKTEETVEDTLDDEPFYGPDFKDPLTGERE